MDLPLLPPREMLRAPRLSGRVVVFARGWCTTRGSVRTARATHNLFRPGDHLSPCRTATPESLSARGPAGRIAPRVAAALPFGQAKFVLHQPVRPLCQLPGEPPLHIGVAPRNSRQSAGAAPNTSDARSPIVTTCKETSRRSGLSRRRQVVGEAKVPAVRLARKKKVDQSSWLHLLGFYGIAHEVSLVRPRAVTLRPVWIVTVTTLGVSTCRPRIAMHALEPGHQLGLNRLSYAPPCSLCAPAR